jgi:RHH-type proline utilization regulon transcriptional repressor/proline dehydrogenase/delta 1-pyrroline-5-carboxylate dehydrogenase
MLGIAAPTEPFETEVVELGRRIACGRDSMRSPSRYVYDRGMAFLARDPQLKAALLRLVDVAPACADAEELADHLHAFLDGVARRTALMSVASRAAAMPTGRRATGLLAGAAVRHMAGRFIVAETPTTAAGRLARLWRAGSAVSLDLLGEATVTREQGRIYAGRCERALVDLTAAAATWPMRPVLERDSVGSLPRVNLSVKVTALTPLVRREAPERGCEDAAGHLRRLLRCARDVGAHLHIDMESMDSRDLVLNLALELLSDPEFSVGPSAGIVLQAYLRDAEETLDRVLEWARLSQRSSPLTVRLVKGAYWDLELIEASQHGWTPPVFTEKSASDRSFEHLTQRLLDAYPLVRTAIASHNVRSIAYGVIYARKIGLAPEDIELQVLRGLGDNLQDAIVAEGLRGRTYCPVGDLVAGMAYLVRRLLENSSNDSFLGNRVSGTSLDELLHKP